MFVVQSEASTATGVWEVPGAISQTCWTWLRCVSSVLSLSTASVITPGPVLGCGQREWVGGPVLLAVVVGAGRQDVPLPVRASLGWAHANPGVQRGLEIPQLCGHGPAMPRPGPLLIGMGWVDLTEMWSGPSAPSSQHRVCPWPPTWDTLADGPCMSPGLPWSRFGVHSLGVRMAFCLMEGPCSAYHSWVCPLSLDRPSPGLSLGSGSSGQREGHWGLWGPGQGVLLRPAPAPARTQPWLGEQP